MRTMLLCLLFAAVCAAAGCIAKGPYYIYGDYIETYGDVGFDELDECAPEETAPEGAQEGVRGDETPEDPGAEKTM